MLCQDLLGQTWQCAWPNKVCRTHNHHFRPPFHDTCTLLLLDHPWHWRVSIYLDLVLWSDGHRREYNKCDCQLQVPLIATSNHRSLAAQHCRVFPLCLGSYQFKNSIGVIRRTVDALLARTPHIHLAAPPPSRRGEHRKECRRKIRPHHPQRKTIYDALQSHHQCHWVLWGKALSWFGN